MKKIYSTILSYRTTAFDEGKKAETILKREFKISSGCFIYLKLNGKIFINNEDINEIELTKLRNSISYITQDNFLFSTTIKDNISLFRNNFNDSEIEASTEKSMISDDIEAGDSLTIVYFAQAPLQIN